MTLEVEFDEPGRFNRLVRRVNQSPIVWTVGLLIPIYIVSFSLAFIALVSDPYIQSPLLTFVLLLISALLVMGYHWFMSRYQRSSNLGQLIQFGMGLAPVVGGFCIVVISIMRAS
ncbi:MAG: hypothetical protein VW683_12810 [Betaproteobacteria bacterium]